MAYMYVSTPKKAITEIVFLKESDISYLIGKKNLRRIRIPLPVFKNIKNCIVMLWELMSFKKP